MADGATALGEAVYAPQFVSAPTILACVAEILGVTVKALKGKRVPPGLVAARSVCILLLAELTLLSQVEMGEALGRRNHTSGRLILRRARLRLEQDKVFAAAFEQARQRLLQGNHA